jgi:hypothetical protein
VPHKLNEEDPDADLRPRVEGEGSQAERMTKKELDRLRRPGVDPRSHLYAAKTPAASTTTSESGSAGTTTAKRTRTAKASDPVKDSERKALRSLCNYQNAIQEELAEAQGSLVRVDLAIKVLEGEVLPEDVRRQLLK